MFTYETKTRVRYADTDKMGIMYYGNYPILYEIGRTEAMRFLGVTYRSLEDEGIIMPVVEMKTRYIKPCYYDDLLSIRTSIASLPTARILFVYEIYNESGELINRGETTLAFVNSFSDKPVRAPQRLLEVLKPYSL